MPETGTPPADGTTGAEGTGTPDPKAGDTNPATGKTFTQAELDAIVQDRVARAKPADYDEAKQALAEKKAREEGEKTDLQKAKDRETELTGERDAARREADEVKRSAAVQIEALKQGADEELVALALAGDTSIEVKDGKVTGAKEAVEKLLERKPNLKTGGTRQSGGEFGGTDGTTVAEEIAALEKKGDKESMAKARQLKIAQHLATPAG